MTFAPEILLGQELGSRFVIERAIRPGTFAMIYEAFDKALNCRVALKVLLPGSRPADISDFDQEGNLLRELQSSSNVVDLVETGSTTIGVQIATSEDTFDFPIQYHALELANGCLTDLLVDLPAVSWSDRLKLYRGVIKGAHQAILSQIVHRDHKSENALIFAETDETFETKIADFGRARLLTNESRLDLDFYLSGRGDLRCAPPEFLWGLGDGGHYSLRQAELYLLGSVLYELGTGTSLTSQTLGDPRTILQKASRVSATQRSASFSRNLPQLRAAYEQAYTLFSEEVPNVIREQGKGLLQDLTAPELERRRTGKFATGRRSEGLAPLLRRIDSMSLNLARAQDDANRLGELKLHRARRRAARPMGTP